MTIFETISLRIIKEQSLIMGPLAWTEAGKVGGMSVHESTASVQIADPSPQTVINQLVARYERLFGQVSREVCKEAVQDLVAELPDAERPTSLV